MPKLVQKVGPLRIHSLNKADGRTAYRVSGTILGEQLRKQFSDQIEAVAWASAQAKASAIQTVVPELADAGLPIRDQLEARRVYAELRDQFPGTSLSQVWEFFRTHHERITTISLKEAVNRYADQRNSEYERKELSEAHSNRLAFFLADFLARIGPDTQLTALTKDRLQKFLRGELRTESTGEKLAPYATKTYNNRRGYLMHFFRWAADESLLQINPIATTRSYRKKEKRSEDGSSPIPILSAEKAAELMAYVESHHEGRLVPYFALCLFTGIRPGWKDGEIRRFQPDFIDAETHKMILPKWVTKTRKTRHTSISPNLQAWLEAYPFDDFPVISRNFKKLVGAVRKRFALEHDVLRHTYISMLVASTKSIASAALEAGNTEDIVWSSYLNLGVSDDAAKKFWSIFPNKPLAVKNLRLVRAAKMSHATEAI